METIATLFITFFACPEYFCDGAVQVQVTGPADQAVKQPKCMQRAELITIKIAAKRNGINIINDDDGNYSDFFVLLLAIRKSENGGPGREFGIIHPRCDAQIAAEPDRSLDIQAGWAAATVLNNYQRWIRAGCPGGRGGFIDYLADEWCPIATDPAGNANWKLNVGFFVKKFRGQ